MYVAINGHGYVANLMPYLCGYIHIYAGIMTTVLKTKIITA